MRADTLLLLAMGMGVAFTALLACTIWKGDARSRLVSTAWFLLAWGPFPLGVALQFGQDISSLPISALTVGGLAAIAALILVARPKRPFPREPRGIAIASMVVWMSMIICDIAVGAPMGIRAVSGALGMVVVFLTLDATKAALVGLRAGLASICLASIYFGLTTSSAWFLDTERFPLPIQPPFPGRLQGIAFQPNHLGQIAGLLVVLTILGPAPRWSRIPASALGMTVLLYTGSRSSLLGVLAAAAVTFLLRRNKSATWWFGALMGLGVMSWVLAQASQVGSHTGTLNGRQVIWSSVTQSFLSHPLFGVGPSGWEQLETSFKLNFHAAHANNQLFDTLGKQGLVGLAALIAWLVVTGWTIARLKPSQRVLPGALFGFLLARSIFEVPLDVYYFSVGTVVVTSMCAAVSWVPAEESIKEPEPERTLPQSRASGRLKRTGSARAAA